MSEDGIAQFGGNVGEPFDCLLLVGVDELLPEHPNVAVTPNPSTGRFCFIGSDGPMEVRIVDATGRQLMHTEDRTIDLSGQLPGVYTAVLSTSHGWKTLRLVLVAQ